MIAPSILCVALLLLMPVGAAAALRRRRATPWSFFFVGVATFTVSQTVHLPILYAFHRAGWLPSTQPGEAVPLGAAAILGVLAGLCEESMRAAGYALVRRARGVKDGVMMGLGHGGIEAMVLGGVVAAANLGAYLALRGGGDLGLAPEAADALRHKLDPMFASPLGALPGVIERALAMGLHVSLSLLVLQAFRRRSPALVGIAIGYHAAVDAIGVFAASRIDNVWLVEAMVAAMTAPGAIWAIALARRTRDEERASPALSLGAEIAVFAALLRKELWQLARTYRVLIALVVFAFLGISSPLLAKLGPELIRRFAGSKLVVTITEPTAFDALAQYDKQLTQIGLLIMVLIAMGTVAGEKERGTAAMDLCKPVPRWSFIASKWAALAILCLASVMLAAGGALFYAHVLFGAVPLGPFALLSLLLYAYLLCFTTAAVLASTLVRSVGAAAGLSLAVVVALFALGAVPWIQGLAPTAMLAWAASLTQAPGATAAASSAPNLGSVAMTATLVILLLLGAVAAFEEQEL